MLISIIIPTFNRAHLISKTLDSFIAQTYTNWEIVVIDDGSEDNTREVVTAYEDKRIKYFIRDREHKKGPSGCRNYGFQKSKGEYVLFFDDDDIAHPELLKICVEQFQKQTLDFCRYKREVFYGDFDKEFDERKKFDSFFIDSNDLEKMITNQIPFNTCAVVWKRSCFQNEKFNEDLFYSDEWECYQRVLSNDIKGISINKVLLYARKHEISSTQKFKDSNYKYLSSTRKAMVLTIKNLEAKKRLNKNLFLFFVRNGFVLDDYKIINEALDKYDSDFITRLKYRIGYKFYPVIKPFFKIKAKIKKD